MESSNLGPQEGGCYKEIHKKLVNKQETPTIVCLCGSTRFKLEYEQAMLFETMMGKIVLTVGFFGHADHPQLICDGELKAMLDELHLRKIDLADEVLFLNVGGYMGESTISELKYAYKAGKRLRFLEDVSNELRAMHGIL